MHVRLRPAARRWWPGRIQHLGALGGRHRKGFVVVVCRACPDPPCARVCPTDALLPVQGGGVR
jgi:Fe-S-cluster-containing dehydrogenase component